MDMCDRADIWWAAMVVMTEKKRGCFLGDMLSMFSVFCSLPPGVTGKIADRCVVWDDGCRSYFN